ncbi:MAG: rsxB 1 [Firmicutes bacterium]|nr:rsxB 1 [Bacillota bacterium]
MWSLGEYFHSVCLDPVLCKGCVGCIKSCPTEAIRIREGKAQITESRCIDCGECIRRCPNHAKTAITNTMSDLAQYEYNIALPAPTLYAQFKADVSIAAILCGLMKIGFDGVYEVAKGAEMVSLAMREYLQRTDIKRPAISSACPAIVRLIQVKFPELLDYLVPFEAPVEVVARMALIEYSKQFHVEPKKIGTWFITPCPAKMTAIKEPVGLDKSNVAGTIAISQIYGDLLRVLPKIVKKDHRIHRASWQGIGWAVSGGEKEAAGPPSRSLVVHDIQSASEILEQVYLGKMKEVDYIECLACAGGCIGGPLTVENRFVAEANMQKRLQIIRQEDLATGHVMGQDCVGTKIEVATRRPLEARPAMQLDKDIIKAMHKVELIETIYKKLPGLDCGSCGSPTCKALAEDIAQGMASKTDCVFKLRESVCDLAQEMVGLARKLPPSLDKGPNKLCYIQQKKEDNNTQTRYKKSSISN